MVKQGTVHHFQYCRLGLVISYEVLRGPAWAVGSCSISQSAGRIYQNITFKTLRQTGKTLCSFDVKIIPH